MRGKFQLFNFRASTSSPIWGFGRPGVLTIGWNDILRRTQYLVKKYGLAAVEKEADWPVGRSGFVEAFIQPQPLDAWFPGGFLQSTEGLTKTKTIVYRGHSCEVMSSRPTKYEKMGYQKSIVTVDTRTHFIWREDIILIPRPDTIYAPQRSSTYVVYNRQVTHIPARFLKFPQSTRFILPTCMGTIVTPPGAVKMNLPPVSAFFGYSLASRIRSAMQTATTTKPTAPTTRPTNDTEDSAKR